MARSFAVLGLAVVLTSAAVGADDILPERLGRLPRELAKQKIKDAEAVDVMFMASLGRFAKPAEKETVAKHVQNTKDRLTAFRDIQWALINSREFLIRHDLLNDAERSKKFVDRFQKEFDKK